MYEDVLSYQETEKYRNWYSGVTMLELPVDKTQVYSTTSTTKGRVQKYLLCFIPTVHLIYK